MGCETYDNGSEYCEDGAGWSYYDAESESYSEGYFDQSGQPVKANGNLVTIADAVASVFGGGQRGYYAPDRNQQYPRGNYPNQQGGFNAQGNINRGGISTGFNVSTNTLMLIAGGVLIFILGQKKGR